MTTGADLEPKATWGSMSATGAADCARGVGGAERLVAGALAELAGASAECVGAAVAEVSADKLAMSVSVRAASAGCRPRINKKAALKSTRTAVAAQIARRFTRILLIRRSTNEYTANPCEMNPGEGFRCAR